VKRATDGFVPAEGASRGRCLPSTLPGPSSRPTPIPTRGSARVR